MTSQFSLWTDAVGEDGEFDPRYTCDLDNSSPEIHWDGEPLATASYVLMLEDLDDRLAQWLIYMIPRELHHLPAGIPPQDALPNGIRQGLNSHGKLGYTGPCPQAFAEAGSAPHHYCFRLYALAATVEIPARSTRDTLLHAIEPFILEITEFHAHYTRRLLRQAG